MQLRHNSDDGPTEGGAEAVMLCGDGVDERGAEEWDIRGKLGTLEENWGRFWPFSVFALILDGKKTIRLWER